MAIYTSFEMVEDCKAGLRRGWAYFVSEFEPIVAALAAHYCAEHYASKPSTDFLRDLHTGEFFQSVRPSTQREFAIELRQALLALLEAACPTPAPDIELSLGDVATALAPLTPVEKQMAWLETMKYEPAHAALTMNAGTDTVERLREKSEDLLRQSLDRWKRGLLRENGLQLRAEAAARSSQDCVPVKLFLDILDGRVTWSNRQNIDRHLASCWHCIDRFCRTREIDRLVKDTPPLTEEKTEIHLEKLGFSREKAPFWKRILAR
ncbi:MAG: hypothetical protein KJZ78_10320 [Bryobacteraceae bacterium]|nr:hypothetical protein [Bryobacteraceae bacterium]